MIIENCRIIYEDKIESGSIQIEAGKITAINPKDYKNERVILDAQGYYLSPGFIDIHLHGAGGHDVMDGSLASLKEISKTIVQYGTTGFLPTTMTGSYKSIHLALSAVEAIEKKERKGAQVLGVHLEGPFINPEAKGAQYAKWILKPSIENYKKVVGRYEKIIRSITLAPEIEGARQLIQYVTSRGIKCCVGHTKATYEQSKEAISWGVVHTTHLFNGMSGLNHREPGVVGATFNSNITTEIICDGIHVAYPVVKIAYKQKTVDQLILITDAMRGCCMPEGAYTLGGQEVRVNRGSVRLKDGTLAGSVLTLNKGVRNIYQECDIPLYEAVKMASYNPAIFCGVGHQKGKIAPGYDADLILFDDEISVKKVWIKGQEVFSNEENRIKDKQEKERYKE